MPYITQDQRRKIDPFMVDLVERAGEWSDGEFNYVLSRIVAARTNAHRPATYAFLNSVYGVLAAIKSEFYRRVVAPYEDVKCHGNGDVFNA